MAENKNGVILITGASGGIGYELALVCAQNKHDLLLSARNAQKLNDIKIDLETRYNIRVHLFPADLSLPGKALELHNYCHEQGIVINNLINNAGYGDFLPVAKADPAVYANLLQLNVTFLTELTTLFVKDMVSRGRGRILNVASTAAYQPVPQLAVYAASKSYVVSFTEALHAELKGTGVTATVLSPGPTKTDFFSRAQMNASALTKGKQQSARRVAEAGYRAMMAGKLYIIPGWKNKLMALGSRLMPSRRAVLAVSALIAKESH